jgi:hypothetical protein
VEAAAGFSRGPVRMRGVGVVNIFLGAVVLILAYNGFWYAACAVILIMVWP